MSRTNPVLMTVSRLRSILSKNLIVLLLIELSLRGAVGVGLIALPAGGLAGFDATQHGLNAPVARRLYRPDRDLIRRMHSNFRMVYPRKGILAGGKETFEVRTNAHGFRSRPFTPAKPAGVFRIICLGDSSTFGLNVEQADAYPQVIERLLAERFPGRFEVLNLGSPGYTGRQGLELLRQQAIQYDPDIVTFAFGTNDRFFNASMSDDAVIGFHQSFAGSVLFALREGLDHSYTYRLLKRFVMQYIGRPERTANKQRRVSIEALGDNIVRAHHLLATHGGSLVILNNDFAATDAIKGMAMAVEQTGARLLDMQEALQEVKRKRSEKLASELGLATPTPPAGMILFRVLAPGKTRVLLEYTRFGQEAESVPLRDDGTAGDQVAGDDVWSGYIKGRASEKLRYSYWTVTESTRVKEFRESGVLRVVRRQFVPATRVADIDVFGDPYLYSDGAHPDEEGHLVIAETLLTYLLGDEKVQAFLASHSQAPEKSHQDEF